jgi:hypothetical protein
MGMFGVDPSMFPKVHLGKVQATEPSLVWRLPLGLEKLQMMQTRGWCIPEDKSDDLTATASFILPLKVGT